MSGRKDRESLLLFGALDKNHLYSVKSARLQGKKHVRIYVYLNGLVGSWQKIPLYDLMQDESEVARKIIAKIATDRLGVNLEKR